MKLNLIITSLLATSLLLNLSCSNGGRNGLTRKPVGECTAGKGEAYDPFNTEISEDEQKTLKITAFEKASAKPDQTLVTDTGVYGFKGLAIHIVRKNSDDTTEDLHLTVSSVQDDEGNALMGTVCSSNISRDLVRNMDFSGASVLSMKIEDKDAPLSNNQVANIGVKYTEETGIRLTTEANDKLLKPSDLNSVGETVFLSSVNEETQEKLGTYQIRTTHITENGDVYKFRVSYELCKEGETEDEKKSYERCITPLKNIVTQLPPPTKKEEKDENKEG